jgi:hypothetical protein
MLRGLSLVLLIAALYMAEGSYSQTTSLPTPSSIQTLRKVQFQCPPHNTTKSIEFKMAHVWNTFTHLSVLIMTGRSQISIEESKRELEAMSKCDDELWNQHNSVFKSFDNSTTRDEFMTGLLIAHWFCYCTFEPFVQPLQQLKPPTDSIIDKAAKKLKDRSTKCQQSAQFAVKEFNIQKREAYEKSALRQGKMVCPARIL